MDLGFDKLLEKRDSLKMGLGFDEPLESETHQGRT